MPADPQRAAPADVAAAVIEAINSRDPDRLRAALDDASEVVTGRTTHRGAEAILAWAAREYDHLVRRYAIDDYRTRGERVLALGTVQYAWAEDGTVADSSPIALDLTVRGEVLRRLSLRDDTLAALAEFSES